MTTRRGVATFPTLKGFCCSALVPAALVITLRAQFGFGDRPAHLAQVTPCESHGLLRRILPVLSLASDLSPKPSYREGLERRKLQ